MKRNCYICRKKTNQEITNKEIRGKKKCKVFKCLSCNLQYLDEKFVKRFLTEKFYRKEYVKLYDKKFFKNTNNHYAKIFEKIRNFTKNKKVLEIGAGGGYLYHYLKKNVKKYEAVELSDVQRKYLKKKFEIKTYKEIYQAPKEHYDVVIIVSVLEHVTDPVKFLKELKPLLAKSGKIIIECPSINDPLIGLYGVQSYKDFYYRAVHLNYFDQSHLKKIIERSGMKVFKSFSVLVYSLTNHLRWIYNNERSTSSNDATNIFIKNIRMNKFIENMFKKLNEVYFKELSKSRYSDMEIMICGKKQ